MRGRKPNISPAFVTQSCFTVPSNIRLNCRHYCIIKIQNKRELQQIASDPSLDIGFQDFANLYKKCTANPYSILMIDTTRASDNPLRFRKNLSERI